MKTVFLLQDVQDWQPKDIYYAISKAGTGTAAIAKTLRVSHQSVCEVVRGKSKSRRIATHIAGLIGRSLDELWPGRYPALEEVEGSDEE